MPSPLQPRVFNPTIFQPVRTSPIPQAHTLYYPHLFLSLLHPHPDKIVIVTLAGASRNPSTRASQASLAISFGPDSPLNQTAVVPPEHYLQTTQFAEICAARRVMDWFQHHSWKDFKGIVVVTDSEYLFTAMTEWIFYAERRGGLPAVEGTYEWHLQELHTEIVAAEAMLPLGVRFWKVRREDNAEAVRLAESVL